jgi:hypothetical protein
MRGIGTVVGAGDDTQGQAWMAGFRRKLQEPWLGRGHNIKIDVRWGGVPTFHFAPCRRGDRVRHYRVRRLLHCMSPQVALRVNSLQSSSSVAFGSEADID